MTFPTRTRLVNPRLGTYFGIFASLLVALFFVAAILEQLGIADGYLRWLMLIGPIALYTAIGLASATSHSQLPCACSVCGISVPRSRHSMRS